MCAMSSADYLTSIEADGAAILAAAQRDALAPTPQCPGWTVGHVVAHVGRAFRWMEELVRERIQVVTFPTPNRGSHDRLAPDLLSWFEEGLLQFLTTMRAADPDEPVWAWSGDNRAEFWMRLQAHETAVHRTDAQSAFGPPDPVPSPLAGDAIEGLLTWFVPGGRARSMLPCAGKLLRFEVTDSPDRWQLRIDAHAALEPPVGQPHVIVRGAASDLLLYLWQRTDWQRLQVEGERELAERYRELAPLP